MERHAVPENIMDVEFKLFGSLTAKQFGYILGGGLLGLLSYYIFKSLGSTFLGWIFAGISVILGLSLALIRINEQPFEIWLGNFINAMFSSQKRVWKKEKRSKKHMNTAGSTPQSQQIVRGRRSNSQVGAPQSNNVQPQPNLQNSMRNQAKNQQESQAKFNQNQVGGDNKSSDQKTNIQNQMSDSSSNQNRPQQQNQYQTRQQSEDIRKADQDITESDKQKQTSPTNNITTQKKMLNNTNTQPKQNNSNQNLNNNQANKNNSPLAGQPSKPNTFAVPGSAQKGVSMMNKQDTNPVELQQQNKNLQSQQTADNQNHPNASHTQNNQISQTNQQAGSDTTSSTNQIQQNQPGVSALKQEIPPGENSSGSASANLNSVQNNQNSIDPAFKTSQTEQTNKQDQNPEGDSLSQQQGRANSSAQPDQIDQDSTSGSIDNKAKTYSDVLPSKSEVIQNQQPRSAQNIQDLNQSSPAEDVESQNADQVKQLREKVADYSSKNQKLQKKLEDMNSQLQQLKTQYQQMSQSNEELKQKLITQKEQKSQTLPDPSTLPQQQSNQASQSDKVMTPKVYNGPYLTKKANVISGIVKSRNGDLLPGVVVIVKNDKNRPVRAMKTNSLGQFITTTSLDNGKYVVELSKNEYSFGRYEVELDGNVLPTYEFVAN